MNVPTPWPLTATSTSLLSDTVRVPWTTGAEDEAGAEEEEDEAGAEEADPDDDEPDVPGAGCEPGPVASTAGTVGPPGLADGASPLPPAPGELPGPREGAPRELATTPGPALPRAPAPGAWECADRNRVPPGSK